MGERDTSVGASSPRTRRSERIRVELLHHPRCRSAPAVYRLVQECLSTLAISAPIHVRVGPYHSPTLLINGIDMMYPGRHVSAGSACRLDLPTRERLLAALTAQPRHE